MLGCGYTESGWEAVDVCVPCQHGVCSHGRFYATHLQWLARKDNNRRADLNLIFFALAIITLAPHIWQPANARCYAYVFPTNKKL